MAKTIADQLGSKEADLAALRVGSKALLCIRLLIEAGLSLEKDVQAVIDDPDFRRSLVEIWKTGCKETSTSQLVARGIMGPDMAGIAEMFDCLGIAFSKDTQLSGLDTIPFPAELLRACKGKYFLFPGFTVTIMDMMEVCPALFSKRAGNWYYDKSFAKHERVQCRWYLLRKSGVLSGIVRGKEVVPRACEVVLGIILARRLGQDLFTKGRVACQGEGQEVIYVGLTESGISIGNIRDDQDPQPDAAMVVCE